MAFRLIRKTLGAVLILLTLITMAAYGLAAFNPYAGAGSWIVSMTGLFYPILLVILLLLAVMWAFIRWRWSLVCLLVALAGFRSFRSTFAFNGQGNGKTPSENSITVMSYNVHEFRPVTGGGRDGLERFCDFIRQENPDVLCLQEMDNSHRVNFMAFYYLERTRKALKMPYSCYSRDFCLYDSTLYQGTLILSHLPITDSGRIKLTSDAASPWVIYADVVKGKDTVRIISTHLQSFALNHTDIQDLHKTEHLEQGTLSTLPPLIRRFRRVFRIHDDQAATLRTAVDASPYPVILCGDFNSVPNSHAYYEARGQLQDAFLSKGRGIGTTYSRLSRTLRIDYIFADPALRILSFHTVPKLLSDHYPVIARIGWPQ